MCSRKQDFPLTSGMSICMYCMYCTSTDSPKLIFDYAYSTYCNTCIKYICVVTYIQYEKRSHPPCVLFSLFCENLHTKETEQRQGPHHYYLLVLFFLVTSLFTCSNMFLDYFTFRLFLGVCNRCTENFLFLILFSLF